MSTKQQATELKQTPKIFILEENINRNIKYAIPETAFVTQAFVKTCLYSQMKDMSRDSLTRSLKIIVCESCKYFFLQIDITIWKVNCTRF